MATQMVYLVVGVDRSVRVGKRPRVQPGEVALPIRLVFPDRSPYLPTVQIDVPDLGPSNVDYLEQQ